MGERMVPSKYKLARMLLEAYWVIKGMREIDVELDRNVIKGFVKDYQTIERIEPPTGAEFAGFQLLLERKLSENEELRKKYLETLTLLELGEEDKALDNILEIAEQLLPK